MEIEPDVMRHDKTPNLKLVMNPEGKLHDWSDLPEEDLPEMAQVVMVGNPEIAKTLSTSLNDCKGRGKTQPYNFFKVAAPSFAGSFRQVFDNRRGIFEKSKPHTNHTLQHQYHPSQAQPLARSKTLPDMPKATDEENRHNHKEPPSPMVPKRTSSKQMVAMMVDNAADRRPLRSFFANA